MKTKIILSFSVLVTTFVLCSAAFAGGASYYIDSATNVYHKKWDCAEINEANRPLLVEISEPFWTMQRCELCFSDMSTIPSGTRSFHYMSPYDTGDTDRNFQAGVYVEGIDITAGVYAAEAWSESQGELVVLDEGNSIIHDFHMQDGTEITFYLGKHMTLQIPEKCTVQKLVYHPLFQDTKKKTELRHARYVTMLEIPGRLYSVTSLPGEKGYCFISGIPSEYGAEPEIMMEIPVGEMVQIDLRDRYDTFVEFINCVVWPSEDGVG